MQNKLNELTSKSAKSWILDWVAKEQQNSLVTTIKKKSKSTEKKGAKFIQAHWQWQANATLSILPYFSNNTYHRSKFSKQWKQYQTQTDEGRSHKSYRA